MLYEKAQSGQVKFFVLGGLPLNFLDVLPDELMINALKLMASAGAELIYPEDLGAVPTVLSLSKALQKYSEIHVDDLWLALENDMEYSVHDNSEMTLTFPNELCALNLTHRWLETEGYDADGVWAILKKYSKSYVLITPLNHVNAVFETFDAYLEHNSAWAQV